VYLSKEEERIYDGEAGWAKEISIKILVKLGEIFDAERLIPIESAHISGVSYKTAGDAAIDFLKSLVNAGGKVCVPSTLNPSSFDEKLKRLWCVPREYAEKQNTIIKLYENLGVNLTLTCTPYYIKRPRSRCHVAWAESSAIVYANSILNVYTNREGAPSALASAIIGKTPDYGLHRDENRRPNIQIIVDFKIKREDELGALGFHVGRLSKNFIPAIHGIEKLKEYELKLFGAAMAAGGMTPMFHIGYAKNNVERIHVGREEVNDVIERLSHEENEIDAVFIGCPHCSSLELNYIANMISGKKIKPDIKFIVCTSRFIAEKSREAVKVIKKAGGWVVCDTCLVVAYIEGLKIHSVLTNSVKAAYYLPSLGNVRVSLADMERCVKFAVGLT